MTDRQPTRAEARDAVQQLHEAEHTIAEHTGGAPVTGVVPITYHAELAAEPQAPEFLPLAWRRVLFLLWLLGLVAAPLVAVQFPEYGDAIELGANMLGVVGLGTALANPTRR